jgi:polygalacturonase
MDIKCLISGFIGVGALIFSAGVATVEAQDYSWDHLPVITRPVFRRDSFSITAYGAVPDGITLNTAAINSAIEDCSRKGGGVVVVPQGLWVTGPIVLRSHVNLYVARAAILQFTADHGQYPIVVGNWEGHPAARCQSPLSGTDLEDVAITGTGIIDGNGDGWRWVRKDSLTEAEWRAKVASGGVVTEDGKMWFPSEQSLKGFRTRDAGVLKPGMTVNDFADVKDFLRPNLLVLTNCSRVLLDGPSFQNSAAWCLHTLLCEDLTVHEVRVRNPSWAVNGDGIDVESCRDVLIENSTFDAGDDGICVKSGRDEDGRRRGRPTENMIVRNNIVYRAHGGFVVGSEMSGGVRNIFVSDCSFIGTDIGLRFKTVRGRGGVVEKIFVKNISMRNIRHQAVFLDMYYFAKPPSIAEVYAGTAKDSVPPVTEATPQFRDIHISNVVCDGAEEGIFVRGLPEMNIRDIYFDHMVLKAAKGAELAEAQQVHLNDIRLVTSDSDPVIYVENSSQLTFDHISYNPGAGLLFSINGDKCSAIRVRDTDASKAVRNAAFQYGAVPKTLEIN